MPTQQEAALSAYGVIFVFCMGIMLFVLPKRTALLPIILTACWMTLGQQTVIAGINLPVLRLIIAIGFIRIFVRQELQNIKWHRLDLTMLLWAICGVTTYTLLWQTTSALINRLGVVYDVLGCYYFVRAFICSADDIRRTCQLFCLALLPVAICMCYEKETGYNVYSVLGGVPAYSSVRDGIIRCQGPFGHPILAGTFGGIWLPLSAWLVWQAGKIRIVGLVGLASTTLITICSGSSGPVMTYGAGLLALGVFSWRNHMRTVRWAILLGVLALQLAMNQPVWFIFARVNIFSGSTGWHRSHLIDQTLRHIGDWWLIGTKLSDLGGWGVWASDATNQFVVEGITGGLPTLGMFIALICIAFSKLGENTKSRKCAAGQDQQLAWALGCTLFAHIITFLSVSYFDQNWVNWSVLFAMVSAATSVGPRTQIPQRHPAIQKDHDIVWFGQVDHL